MPSVILIHYHAALPGGHARHWLGRYTPNPRAYWADENGLIGYREQGRIAWYRNGERVGTTDQPGPGVTYYATEDEIPADLPQRLAATVPVLRWSGAADGQVADVWECETQEAAGELLAKFRRQGSRRRLCSVCNPGNARGAGRGRWERRTLSSAEGAPEE